MKIIQFEEDFYNPLLIEDSAIMAGLSEVVQALKQTPNSGKLDVRGSMGLKGNLFKFDTITFDDSSTLILETVDASFVAIATKEIILDIKNPTYKAFLSRPIGLLEQQILESNRGIDGIDGQTGATGATHDRVGQPGLPGGSGSNGSNGKTQQLPQVFFFVQNFKFGTGATPSKQYFSLYFQGLPGGSGGKGGSGGQGGRGGNGDNGVSDLWGCREGGGPGGGGGNGGNGGDGGDGALGGNGGSLFLFAPKPDMFDYSTANIEGGPGGVGGGEGMGGGNGRGGTGAAQVGFCGAKPNGRIGQSGKPGTRGDNGASGQRGVQIIKQRDNSDLF